MWLHSPNINCTHGFSTRHGGVSKNEFESLNLGGHQDDAGLISHNRKVAFDGLNFSLSNLCHLKQVHGNTVCEAKVGQQEGDALVTNQTNLVLAISIADCYPILFYDEKNKVIGSAHAGWRGTLGKIAKHTVDAMVNLGAEKEFIKVAIGQGISQQNFEVGNEVIKQFERANFPSTCWENNHIDLIGCNKFVLQQNGILEKNIWTMNRCTFENDFFSYRRDKGITGRMWAVIAMD
jgi:polyphenol oxidase